MRALGALPETNIWHTVEKINTPSKARQPRNSFELTATSNVCHFKTLYEDDIQALVRIVLLTQQP
eukprot:4821954-Amphidinium_carterae.1